MVSSRQTPTVLLLALVLGGCSTSHSTRDPEPFLPAPPMFVEVTNHNWSDVGIYVQRLGARHRLGSVTSMTTRRLEVPRSIVGPGADVQILVDPIGGARTHSTDLILIQPGLVIELDVENRLESTSYSVRGS